MDKRELRLAIQRKFEHRRKLITENSQLRRQVKAADDVLHSKLGNYALDECADEIVQVILEKAFEASMLVADQIAETGDYVVGIDSPGLHIRHRIARIGLMSFGPHDAIPDIPFKHVAVRVSHETPY
jgi:hypothetical protein